MRFCRSVVVSKERVDLIPDGWCSTLRWSSSDGDSGSPFEIRDDAIVPPSVVVSGGL